MSNICAIDYFHSNKVTFLLVTLSIYPHFLIFKSSFSLMASPIDTALTLWLRLIFYMCIVLFEYMFFAMPVSTSPSQTSMSCMFILAPIIPLGHQPGALLHQQYHPILCKS